MLLYAIGSINFRLNRNGPDCPGTPILYTCTVTGSNTLIWSVTQPSGEASTTQFSRSNTRGATQEFFTVGSRFTATLTEVTSNGLTSTLSTTLSMQLDQTVVRCSNPQLSRLTRSSTIDIRGIKVILLASRT